MQYPEELCAHAAQYNVQACHQLKCGNNKAAAQLFKKSCENFKKVLKIDPKDPVAQCNLAYMHHTGNGTSRNAGKALKLYRKSAMQNNTRAMYNLGVIYEGGDINAGVSQDYAEALRWYKKAADAGHEGGAQHNLGAMHYLGYGIDCDKVKAAEWYLESAKKGYTTSMVRLAGMNELGDGIPKNRGAAIQWYRKAASNGDALALNRLRHLINQDRTISCTSGDSARRSSTGKISVRISRKASSDCAMCAKPNTGTVLRCGRCKQVVYCGKACQKLHWKVHKATCSVSKGHCHL